jgi:Txe/YoeB family toxin of Txe-Axe toxin-antitoxin module
MSSEPKTNSGISGATNSVPQTREETKARIIELVKRINRNPKRIERGMPPLEFVDTGYRFVFERSVSITEWLWLR